MKLNETTPKEMYKIEFRDGFAVITVGEKSNRFQCRKEDEEQLSHMMEVIASSSGLFGTDIVGFESIFDKCSTHRFIFYPNRKTDPDDSLTAKCDSKAIILFISGCSGMDLYDVNCIINAVKKDYSPNMKIMVEAEHSEKVDDGYYSLCVLE